MTDPFAIFKAQSKMFEESRIRAERRSMEIKDAKAQEAERAADVTKEVDRAADVTKEVDRARQLQGEMDRNTPGGAPVDLFRRATSLGGFFVVAFVAPVGACGTPSGGRSGAPANGGQGDPAAKKTIEQMMIGAMELRNPKK